MAAPLLAAVATPPEWPAWGFMCSLAVGIFVGCKWLTWTEAAVRAPWWRHLGYWLAWPGMDARAFLAGSAGEEDRPGWREWLFAAAKLAFGMLVLWGVAPMVGGEPLLLGWLGMVGLVFVLHFGSFHLLSCAWRAAGVDAAPLMEWPAAAHSVGEFWGRRWNRAFRDLTHRFLFLPLTAKLGARWALWLAFAASGLVHEAVISLPASGGYGGPTLFFLAQAAWISLERTSAGRALGLGRGLIGRFSTVAVLVLPVGLLFHRPFVTVIIVPLLGALGV